MKKDEKKHILFIHQFATTPDEPGEIRHVEIFKFFSKQNIKTTVISGSVNYQTGKHFNDFKGFSQKKEVGDPDIAFYRVYAAPTYRKGFIGRILTYFTFMFTSFFFSLKFKDVDIVLATSPSLFTGLSGYLISVFKRCPFYFEMRDLWPKVAVEMGLLKNKLVIDLAYKLERFLCHKAVKNIVITEGYAGYIKSLGIKEQNIDIVENGVDEWMVEYNVQNRIFPEKLKSLEGKYIIMHVGAVGKFNYLHEMLDVAELLKDKKDIAIAIVGDGNERENLVNLVKEKRLENVLFTGSVKRVEMGDYLSCADLCFAIYPRIPTGKLLLQNKVLDYLAMAKPVILVAEPGDTSKIIEESGCGFRLDSDAQIMMEKILWCYEKRQASVGMGFKGREYVKKHLSRDILAEKYRKILF